MRAALLVILLIFSWGICGGRMGWRTKARTDKNIQTWYNSIRKSDHRVPADVVQFMSDSPNYDYAAAIENGVVPKPQADHNGQYRWISDNPTYLLGSAATKAYEGWRPNIYSDSEGVPTIGYGFNLNDPAMRAKLPVDVVSGKRALTTEEADPIFKERWYQAVSDAVNTFGVDAFNNLNRRQQSIVVDMAYNLGAEGLGQFKDLKKAILSGDAKAASLAIKDSKYYKQTGRRAKHHVAYFSKEE